jgi:diguanylate cyclase (GGDEF)-like protein/PAS domain S-box-containing protein
LRVYWTFGAVEKWGEVVDVMDGLCPTVLEQVFDGVCVVGLDSRIIYWNKAAETITGYSAADVLGRRCSDGILVHVNQDGEHLCQGNCMLRETMKTGEAREGEVYYRHRDGHRVRSRIRMVPFWNKTGQLRGAIHIFRGLQHLEVLEQKMGELQEMALVDSVTKLGNRRHTEATLEVRLEELSRYGWRFGLLFIDIDHFKTINDCFGHGVGDMVLKLVADTLLNSLRPFDFLGRWGGEEFVAIVANVEEPELLNIANRSRALVEQSSLNVNNRLVGVTVSVGAAIARPGDSRQQLIERADRYMYQSKESGRNRVTPVPVFAPEMEPPALAKPLVCS